MDEYAGDTISVGDLRKALEGLDDGIPVYVDMQRSQANPRYEGYMSNTTGPGFWPASSISNRMFVIKLHGERWDF